MSQAASAQESRLLKSDLHEFPLLATLAGRKARCGACGHAGADSRALLRASIIKYRSDKRFQEHCSRLFRLPCVLFGVLVDQRS